MAFKNAQRERKRERESELKKKTTCGKWSR